MKKALSLILCVVMVMMLAACSGGAASADNYPSKAVQVIVPFTAGGGTDLVTRAIVDAAKDSFPKGIAVENKTGGGGAIGMVAGANAAPDGTVLTTVCVELTTLPHTGTGATLQHDSFKPVLMMNSAYSVLSVKADAPYESLSDFIEAAKTQDLQIGNSGVGAIWHLAAAALGQKAGVEFVHVPFNGAADAVTSLLGGHIDAITVSYPEVSAQVDAGEMKVLAVLAPERLAGIPDVPTAKEEGFDVAVGTWRGIGVPKDTPDEIVEKIYTIFSEAAKTDAFVTFMANNNLDIDIMNPEEFKARIASDNEMFKVLINDLGLAQ